MKRLSAFTLIEIAIALIVMGTLTGLLIPLVTTSYRLTQQRTTETHKEQIFSALAAYVLRHFLLPAPADSSSGEAIENCRNDYSRCMGYVPYKTLGLPEKVAKDGYGRWFTYAVQPALVNRSENKRGTQHTFCTAFANEIQLRSVRTREIVNPEPFNNSQNQPDYYTSIALVLISHGAPGRGALTDSGDRTPATGDEAINIHQDLNFFEGKTPEFDHQVYWLNRDQLMSYYAKSPCTKEEITDYRPQTSSHLQSEHQTPPPPKPSESGGRREINWGPQPPSPQSRTNTTQSSPQQPTSQTPPLPKPSESGGQRKINWGPQPPSSQSRTNTTQSSPPIPPSPQQYSLIKEEPRKDYSLIHKERSLG
jgi:type II secretory pathway pseudopilin PulG